MRSNVGTEKGEFAGHIISLTWVQIPLIVSVFFLIREQLAPAKSWFELKLLEFVFCVVCSDEDGDVFYSCGYAAGQQPFTRRKLQGLLQNPLINHKRATHHRPVIRPRQSPHKIRVQLLQSIRIQTSNPLSSNTPPQTYFLPCRNKVSTRQEHLHAHSSG